MLRSIPVLVGAVLAVAPAAHAASRPDLTVAKLAGPRSAVAGQRLKAVATTHDKGRRAGASKTGLYLSSDRRLGKGDIRLAGGRRVGALRRGHSARGTIRAKVPKTAAAGAYYLLACADAGRRVRERSERDNCRAAKQRIAIVAHPRPLTVRTTADAARAARATIGSAGGTLRATGADGTVYVLSIPAGALPAATTLTLTPLASLAKTGLAAARGVEIGPDGLHPLIAPTLTVTPHGSVPASRRAVFAFDGAGGEFHLHPAAAAAGGFELRTPRLGGYGFAVAKAAARRRFAAAHPPTAVIDQLAQAIAASGATARIAGGPAGAFPRDATDALILATAQGIESQLAAGTVPAIDAALQTYTWWDAMAAAQEAHSPGVSALRASLRHAAIPAAAHLAALNARVSCASGKDLNAVADLLTLRAYGLVLADIDFARDDVEAAIGACLRFTVSYEAEVNENEANGAVAGDIVVDSANAPVTLAPAGDAGSTYVLQGSLPLVVTRYDFFDYLCDRHGGTATPQAPGTITIHLTPALPFDSYVPGHANAIVFPPPTLSVTFFHGSVKTTNACGLEGFSGGLYDRNLPRIFADIYDGGLGQFVLPAVQFTAQGGAAQTLFDGSRPATTTTDAAGHIRLTIAHSPSP